MARRSRIMMYVVFGLIIIGFLATFVSNPSGMIIPVAVFGIIFFLYKFPPQAFRGRGSGSSSRRGPIEMNKVKTKKKANPFRVINGNKRDDEEDPPHYH